ncbi:MAG: SusC/RagA family TonB-linked outer membrane protein, partial [Bacteroidota bacterium]|nr:SusC/RagA family TonB-linked outer membrane protein [Bacteroidota bacterium]
MFFLALMQVTASSYSQQTRLNLKFEKETLESVFSKIEANSDFSIFYKNELIKDSKDISGEFKNALIFDILDQVLKTENLTYTVRNRLIMIVPKEGSTIELTSQQQQKKSVTGKVTDSSGGSLPGVSVVVKGTTTGTITDANGNYSLSNVPESATLQFSFVGMKMQEFLVGNKTTINVVLEEETIGIDEVVAVGYGTQKKINLTGAVDVVKAEEIARRGVTSVVEALQGVSPNLNISTGAFSGEPGGKMSMNIRGKGSLTGDDSPYVLVDGVPTDLHLINSEDIESITILKDAAASAIYGARAPYGVILVTTKKGKNNEMVKISYSNNISLSSPLGLPHMSNALKYATAFDQASVNAGLSPNFTPENYERIRQYMAGNIKEETRLKPDGSDWEGNGIWSLAGNGNNDWMYIYYKDNVLRQKHDVSISGGDAKNSFFVSAGYVDQPGELRYGDESYNRYNVTTNITSNPTKWL